MREKRVFICLLFCFFLVMGITSSVYAGTAEVLPKGVFSLKGKYSYYLPIDTRFDPDGHDENIAADFNGVLNSSVFPDLALIEEFFALPAGSASIGNSVADFEYNFQDIIFDFQYGLTDNISLGIKVPYYINKNKVNAALNTTNATVGINPSVPGGVAPLFVPGTRPLTSEDVQNLLGNGLDTNGDGNIDIAGFGYKRFETWSGSGFADIEIGARYQYLNTENWRLAFTGGVRLPTGEVDDPDNLVDIGFGSGAWALLFRLNNDYTGIENFVFDVTFQYDLVLPDKETLRVPIDPDQPITSNKEEVDRDQGDIFEFQVSAAYSFLEAFGVSLEYDYSFALKDRISGDMRFAYESLEEESDWTEHLITAGLSYSTIPLFQKKKFSIPLVASIEYENVFAGSNNILKQQVFTIKFSVFF